MFKSFSIYESLTGATAVFQVLGCQFFSLDSDSFTDGFKKVSKKHKISLAFSVFLLSLQLIGIFYAISLEKKIQQNDNVTTGLTVQFASYFIMVAVITTSILHLLASTGKAKKIFCNFEIIFIIFVNELHADIDYTKFSNSYKTKFIKITSCFVVASTTVLSFIFYYNQSNIFLWTLLAIYPYFFIQVGFCYLNFFVLLVRENLLTMKDVLEKLHSLHDLSKKSLEFINVRMRPRGRSDELFEALVMLKRIYVMLCETTVLINDVCGIPMLIQVMFVITCNISAGYKVYLAFRGEIVLERVGGEIVQQSIHVVFQ